MRTYSKVDLKYGIYQSNVAAILGHEFSNSIIIIDKCLEKRQDILAPIEKKKNHIIFELAKEPSTQRVNEFCSIIDSIDFIDSIIGIGGGSIMDLAKAISVTYSNGKKSELLQGWNIPQKKGLKSLVIPTIPGSGAEISRTAVLKGPLRKLGINSDYTMPDYCLIDPSLYVGIPAELGIPTLLDCYIHCEEVLHGNESDTFSRLISKEITDRFEYIFENHYLPHDKNLAEIYAYCSYLGGLSLLGGIVGACHALSYGLSHAFNIRHSVANLISLEVLEDFYGDAAQKAKEYCMLNNVHYWTEFKSNNSFTKSVAQKVHEGSIFMEKLWRNVTSKEENWEKVASKYISKLINLLEEKL